MRSEMSRLAVCAGLRIWPPTFSFAPTINAILKIAAYRLPWFDAHRLAYAEFYGLSPVYREDFEPGTRTSTVEILNPPE